MTYRTEIQKLRRMNSFYNKEINDKANKQTKWKNL